MNAHDFGDRRAIAVVGAGVAGLTAAYVLAQRLTSRAENETMDERVANLREEVTAGLRAPRRGREKGVWGVERACHTGQQRSLQSACVTQETARDLGSRAVSRYGAASV